MYIVIVQSVVINLHMHMAITATTTALRIVQVFHGDICVLAVI